MKRFALLAALMLIAIEPAAAQDNRLNGEWNATNYRCNCGNMMRKPSVYQSGYDITFTNPCGESSPGERIGERTFRATMWGVNATITSRATIQWSNGCVWTREWGPRHEWGQ
jgi:hypothetical protein